MASTISAGTTTTTALVQTADTSGVLQLQTNGTTTAITVDTLQNVGIGSTAPSTDGVSGYANLVIGNSSATASGITLRSTNTGTPTVGLIFARGTGGTNGFVKYDQSVDALTFGSGGSERARIDNSGSFIVGATNTTSWGAIGINSKSTAASQQCFSGWNADTSGTRYFAYFGVGATYTNVGSIYYNGTATIYGSVSDERLKTNIVDANSGLAKLANVRIRSFDWKDSGNHTDFGVVAQELNEVAPEAVGQGIDKEDGSIDKPWSVDTSVLTPAIIKAIQELSAQVTTLQTQVTALKG